MSTAASRVPSSLGEDQLHAVEVAEEPQSSAHASPHDVLTFPHAAVPIWLRAIEIFIALFAIILFFPVMLLEAIIIRLGTPGPALFFQQRVGVNRKLFTFVKFRTLYADARERFPELYAYKYS